MIIMRLRARIGYLAARRLMALRSAVAHPRLWRWMEGQFSRMAALGDPAAQSFYGHILLFRGQGLGAKEEGARLLRLAATAGDAKAAYQLGVLSLAGNTVRAGDAEEAARWWRLAAEQNHGLAASRLARLYADGGPGLEADAQQAEHFQALAARLRL
jgi:TPR repeat protein